MTCGSELHPERAARYDYCTRRECREQNARVLTVLAVGVNKAADQYEVLDGRTRAETTARAEADHGRLAAVGTARAPARAKPARGRRPRREQQPPVRSWTRAQQDLARIHNARGMRPDEIARELGLPTGTVIQMLLAARDAR